MINTVKAKRPIFKQACFDQILLSYSSNDMDPKTYTFEANGSGEPGDSKLALEALECQMMKCLSNVNPVENLKKVIERAETLKDIFDLHFRDSLGYTLLGNAVKLRCRPVIEYLIEEKNFQVNEELIIAVEVDYKEAIDFLLRHDPNLINRPVLAGTVCRPGTSPVMVASLKENESMLKFLFSRGAQALEIPHYNPRESRNIIRFDAIYQTMLALSKPMYLCIMNEDPVMVAFKISERCKQIASHLTVAEKDMLTISESCEKFAANFISNTENFEELQLLMDQMTTEDEQIVVPGEPWERLKYALNNNHQLFVADGSVQRLIRRKFFEGPIALKDFESAHALKKAAYICTLLVLAPFWVFFFMCIPETNSSTGKFIKSWLEMPMMRFIVQISLYTMLVAMVATSGPSYSKFNLGEFQNFADTRICVQAVIDGNLTCIEHLRLTDDEQEFLESNDERGLDIETKLVQIALSQGLSIHRQTFTNTTYVYLVDAYIMMWTTGNSYKELQNIWMEGFIAYSSDWVNVFNIVLNLCFFTGMIVKYTYIIQQSGYPDVVNSSHLADPIAVTDMLRALGLSFLIFKLFKSLRITSLVGKPQHLLVGAIAASFNFLLIFCTTILAFSVAMNGMIHSTYFQYLRNCVEDNGTMVVVPCVDRLVFDRGDLYIDASQEEMGNYQNFVKVFADFFLAMFQSNTRIQFNFPFYENPQEWILSMMYTMFAFVMLVVRLNILISLIIFAVLAASKENEEVYKFRRTNLFFMFIAGRDPLPTPFNILPSINRLASKFSSKNNQSSKIFTENELKTVATMRDHIQRLKGTYLRKHRKQNRESNISSTHIENLRHNIGSLFDGLIKGVEGIQKRTQELLDRKKTFKNDDPRDILDEMGSNAYMRRYKNKKDLFPARIGSKLFKN